MKKRRVVIKSSSSSHKFSSKPKKYVKAAEGDPGEDDFMEEYEDDAEGIMDALDEVADNIEDVQDVVDDMDEDDVEIGINNNIADHFIAECNRCGGVFISAVVDSDQVIDHVSGVCPLCKRETEQYLKWVIRGVNEE